MEKRGGWKTSRMTPLPKRGFGPPLVRYVFHPPQVSVLCFPVQKSTTEQTRSSFGGVQKFLGERVLWYVFLPPYVLHPPISRPQRRSFLFLFLGGTYFRTYLASYFGLKAHNLFSSRPSGLQRWVRKRRFGKRQVKVACLQNIVEVGTQEVV